MLLDNIEVRNLGNLELLANQVVEGFIIGLHKSPFHGFSVEFAEHRLYNPGESTKSIDWKVFARTDKMFTKKFEEETNLRCQIVIDASSSMYFPEVVDNAKGGLNKLEFSALAGAAIMNMLQKQRDAFGLSIFDDAVKTHTLCKSNTSHYRLILTYLDQLINNPTRNKTTSTTDALHQIAESIHRRSLVVIFSDMFEPGKDSEQLFSALQHLKHNKHEVVLFHVVDKSKEIDFQYDNRPHIFIDIETGDKVELQPNQVREHYMAQISAFQDELRNRCLQYKIDFVEADINEGFKPILQQYLVKRQKMG